MRTAPAARPALHPRLRRDLATATAAFAALILGAGTASAEGMPAPTVVDHIRAEGDFIDDPFALSDDGARIAWITTDGATRARVHMAPVGNAGVKEASRDYPISSITPERLEWLDDEHVLVVERDPSTHMARGEIVGLAGVAKEKLGPATDIALAVVGGTPAIVTYLKTPTKAGATTFSHAIAAYRRDNHKLIAKKVLTEGADGRVPLPGGGSGKPHFFEDGYSVMVSLKEGGFDKAADIRRPGREARVDLFGGKILTEREIGDVVAFAELALVRKKYQGVRDFVRFDDELQHFQLVDSNDVITELQTPRPLAKYDPQTLAFQTAAPGALYVSLTVDPVNAEAVKAKKADQDYLDVYHLDVKERALTEVARIDGQKRPTAWRLAGGRLGVLRKHKGFGRGGEDLEIFDLGLRKPASITGAAGAASGKAAATKSGAPASKAGAKEAGGGGEAKSAAPPRAAQTPSTSTTPSKTK